MIMTACNSDKLLFAESSFANRILRFLRQLSTRKKCILAFPQLLTQVLNSILASLSALGNTHHTVGLWGLTWPLFLYLPSSHLILFTRLHPCGPLSSCLYLTVFHLLLALSGRQSCPEPKPKPVSLSHTLAVRTTRFSRCVCRVTCGSSVFPARAGLGSTSMRFVDTYSCQLSKQFC